MIADKLKVLLEAVDVPAASLPFFKDWKREVEPKIVQSLKSSLDESFDYWNPEDSSTIIVYIKPDGSPVEQLETGNVDYTPVGTLSIVPELSRTGKKFNNVNVQASKIVDGEDMKRTVKINIADLSHSDLADSVVYNSINLLTNVGVI